MSAQKKIPPTGGGIQGRRILAEYGGGIPGRERYSVLGIGSH
jgi:hypothetical protein